MMEVLKEYIIKDALIMIPTLYVLAEAIKKTETMESRFIPPVLMGVSIILTPWLLGGWTAMNIIQSLLIAGGTNIIYETYKETIKGDEF